MSPLRVCGGRLGGAVVRGDPLDAGAVDLVLGRQPLRRRIGRRRFGHDRRRGRRIDLGERRPEVRGCAHADLAWRRAVERIGARYGRRIGLVLFFGFVGLFLQIGLQQRILRRRALQAARQQIAGLHLGDLGLRQEPIAVHRSEDRHADAKSDHRDDADEPQRAASTGAAEKAAPEPRQNANGLQE